MEILQTILYFSI